MSAIFRRVRFALVVAVGRRRRRQRRYTRPRPLKYNVYHEPRGRCTFNGNFKRAK